MQHVNAIREYLCADAVEGMTCGYGFEFAAQRRSQRASFGQQFEADVGNDAVFYFAINK